jgi:predicted  nucleic acid-binding Zn-ribbon protein
MPTITEEQIATLVKLQKIDTEAQKLESLLKKLPERVQILDERLEKHMRTVEEDKNAISELNKKYRNYESDIQLHLGMIQKSQQKLRSVKTNKEYQSSLKEIEDIKAKNSRIEDEMLEFLERIEMAEKDLNERERVYSNLVDETNLEKDSIKQQSEECQRKLVQLAADRHAVTGTLEGTILEIFYRVKAKQPDAVAIAEVKDAVCQGCHINIPPQLYIELQHRNSLKNCPSCERIIYWEDNNERPE